MHVIVLATVDFSKAFDSIWNSAFFSKLLSISFLFCFVKWIQSYLSNLRLKVCINSFHSRPFHHGRGVPKLQFLDQSFSLFLLMISLSLFLQPFRPPSLSLSLYARGAQLRARECLLIGPKRVPNCANL